MPVRLSLSEVLSALSYSLDLTDGQPAGHTLRTCLIGMRLGREAALTVEQQGALYYALLVKDTGCSSNAARMCQLFGTDDRVLKPQLRDVDRHKPVVLAAEVFRSVALGRPLVDRIRQFAAVARADGVMRDMLQLRCERGADIAQRLGFPHFTVETVRYLDEHWNGRGHPAGLAGPEIPIGARIACIAQVVDAFHRNGGVAAVRRVLRARAGSWFDPELVDIVLQWRDARWWEHLERGDLSAEVLAAEPASVARTIEEGDLDVIASAFADIIDAKSPFTFSHSRNVAAFALGIARELGTDAVTQRRTYRAGLLHDIGKLGVSNQILDKRGALTADERKAIERHPFFTWEILSRVPAFREFAWSAALHHERVDGSGYPWRLSGNRLDRVARILAVADVYEALTAERPYRASMSWDEAWQILDTGRGTHFDSQVLDALESCHAATSDMRQIVPLVAA